MLFFLSDAALEETLSDKYVILPKWKQHYFNSHLSHFVVGERTKTEEFDGLTNAASFGIIETAASFTSNWILGFDVLVLRLIYNHLEFDGILINQPRVQLTSHHGFRLGAEVVDLELHILKQPNQWPFSPIMSTTRTRPTANISREIVPTFPADFNFPLLISQCHRLKWFGASN